MTLRGFKKYVICAIQPIKMPKTCIWYATGSSTFKIAEYGNRKANNITGKNMRELAHFLFFYEKYDDSAFFRNVFEEYII